MEIIYVCVLQLFQMHYGNETCHSWVKRKHIACFIKDIWSVDQIIEKRQNYIWSISKFGIKSCWVDVNKGLKKKKELVVKNGSKAGLRNIS